jgi:Tfp pilus assembly protein PilF
LKLKWVLEALVREQFAFLPGPIHVTLDGWRGVLTYPDAVPGAVAEASRLAERAGRRAGEGDYARAIVLWRRAIKMQPANYLARRDLAMALVEQGESDEAKNQLIDALRIQPDDVWSPVVLANLYIKHEKNLQTAKRLLDHALEVKADDPWSLNGLAVLRMKQGRASEGLDLFERCIATAPAFANPYLGMAMSLMNEDGIDEAKRILDGLFHHGEVTDARSLPIFAEARGLYGSLMADLAKRRRSEMVEALEAMKSELAAVSGRVGSPETCPVSASVGCRRCVSCMRRLRGSPLIRILTWTWMSRSRKRWNCMGREVRRGSEALLFCWASVDCPRTRGTKVFRLPPAYAQ